MPAKADNEVYPLATQEGNSIPLEVAEPIAAASIAFTNVATSLLSLPSDTAIVMCIADKPCWIAFGKVMPAIVDATFFNDIQYIPQNAAVYLRVPQDRQKISVLRAGVANGTLVFQVIRTWRALKQQVISQ